MLVDDHVVVIQEWDERILLGLLHSELYIYLLPSSSGHVSFLCLRNP